MFNENYQSVAEIIKKENENKTFGLDESLIINDNYIINTFKELFEIVDGKKAQDALLQWSKQYSDAELSRMWNTTESRIKRARTALGLIKNKKGEVTIEDNINWPAKSLKNLVLFDKKKKTNRTEQETTEQETTEQTKQKSNQIIFQFGFKIGLDGLFSAQELMDRLESITNLLVSTTESKYLVKIQIEESK